MVLWFLLSVDHPGHAIIFQGNAEDLRLVVRLHNADAADKLNKQCSRAECNVIVIPSYEQFGCYVCVFVCVCYNNNAFS